MAFAVTQFAFRCLFGRCTKLRHAVMFQRKLMPGIDQQVLRAVPSSVPLWFSTNPAPSSGLDSQPTVEKVLKTYVRSQQYQPIDSLLTALATTDAAERATKSPEIWRTVHAVFNGRDVTEGHMAEVWRLLTEHGSGDSAAEAVQCVRLYAAAALAPPASLAAAARASPEGTIQLARCLASLGQVEGAAAELSSLRAAGHPVPAEVEREMIEGYGRAGDPDAARDTAQALLASADDAAAAAELQFCVLLAQVRSRQLRPLEALVSRRSQTDAALSMEQCRRLLTALAETGQQEYADLVLPLVPWQEFGHRSVACRLLQRALVRLQQPLLAVRLLESALKAVGDQKQLTMLARALLREMAATGQEVLLQSEVCAAFSAGSLLPRAWYDSMEVLYRVSRPGDALALMARAHVAGVVLREHMFWPALLPCCRRQDVTGVRESLTQMLNSGVVPGHQTLLEYVLPVFVTTSAAPHAPAVVDQLKDCGLTVSVVLDPLIDWLLRSGHHDAAAATGERYVGSVTMASLVRSVTRALLYGGAGVGPCVRLLRCAVQRRAQAEDPVGSVLLAVSHACLRQPDGTAPGVLNGLIEALVQSELRVSPLAAELVSHRLLPLSLPALKLLPQLADTAVSSESLERADAEPSALLRNTSAVDQKEDHLVELKKKGGNTRKMLRELIFHYCGKGNIERAVQLEEELTSLAVPGEGEPLTAGVLAALMAVHVQHGRLEQALQYRRRLELHPAPAVRPDAFKLMDLATLLVQRDRSDEALSIVFELPAIEHDRVQMNCWRLLSAAADAADPELTRALLDTLVTRDLTSYNVHTLGQVIRAHLNTGEVAAAVEEFSRCVEHHRLSPWSHGLLLSVLDTEDAERRQQLLDTVFSQLCQLHGADSGKLQLAVAFAETDFVDEARTLFSGLPSLWERLKPHCRIQARQGSTDTLLKILRALPVDTRASNVVYWALLSVYERTADVDGVEAVLARLRRDQARGGAKVTSHAEQLLRRLRSGKAPNRAARTDGTAASRHR